MCKHRLSNEESPAFVFIAKSACGGIRPLQACVYILVNWEYYHHSQVILGAPRSSQELPGILRIMFLISTFVRVKPCQMANTKSSAEAMCKDWEKRKGGKSWEKLPGTLRNSQELPGTPRNHQGSPRTSQAFQRPSGTLEISARRNCQVLLRIIFLISTIVRVKPCQIANTEAMCKRLRKEKGEKSCSLHQSQLGFRAAHVVHLKFIGHLKFSLGWDIRL